MNRRLAPIVASFVGVVVLALLWVLVTAEPNAPGDAYSPLIGQPAPAVVTSTIDDAAFDLSRRKGSWVVLNFFNSTCVPCINEHDELVAFADDQRNTPNPAELYTVVNDDSDVAVREFFTRNGGEWPKLRDENGAVAVAFGVARVPETWVIDPNGVVRLRITGELSTGLLDEQLASLRTAFGE
jgi:cytochrome c biogenesis protein CcmG/thiol:disulfide interchange protein DsbE